MMFLKGINPTAAVVSLTMMGTRVKSASEPAEALKPTPADFPTKLGKSLYEKGWWGKAGALCGTTKWLGSVLTPTGLIRKMDRLIPQDYRAWHQESVMNYLKYLMDMEQHMKTEDGKGNTFNSYYIEAMAKVSNKGHEHELDRPVGADGSSWITGALKGDWISSINLPEGTRVQVLCRKPGKTLITRQRKVTVAYFVERIGLIVGSVRRKNLIFPKGLKIDKKAQILPKTEKSGILNLCHNKWTQLADVGRSQKIMMSPSDRMVESMKHKCIAKWEVEKKGLQHCYRQEYWSYQRAVEMHTILLQLIGEKIDAGPEVALRQSRTKISMMRDTITNLREIFTTMNKECSELFGKMQDMVEDRTAAEEGGAAMRAGELRDVTRRLMSSSAPGTNRGFGSTIFIFAAPLLVFAIYWLIRRIIRLKRSSDSIPRYDF